MRRSVDIAACALVTAMLFSIAPPAFAAQPSDVQAGGWYGSVGLSVSRIVNVADQGDAMIYFANPAAPSPVSKTIFGFDVRLPLGDKGDAAGAPALFAEVASRKDQSGVGRFTAPSDEAQAVGVRFNLLGGDHMVAFQSVTPNLVPGTPFQYSGQAPALFAFYNFPQPAAALGLGNDVAPNGRGNAALAPDVIGSALQNNGSSPYGSFAFPLFNTLPTRGPYWYTTYAPIMRGPTVQLNFPVMIAKIPAKIRVGEQALTEVQPSSLATQIFGPGFASSVGKYSALGGGVTLALPVFDRRATVSLDGLYESLQRNDKTPFLYAAGAGLSPDNPFAGTQPGAAPTAVVYYPNYANLRQYLGAASLAVPVSSSLTLRGIFSEQRYSGEALDTLTQNLSQRKLGYGGGVAYNIPNTNSSVNLFFNRFVYTDDAVPTYNWTENRQNIYFSVRF